MTNKAAKKHDPSKKTVGGFMALRYVTTACNSIQNTVFVLPDNPSNDLLQLKTNMGVAEQLATEWVGGIYNKVTYKGLAPDMTADIANSVVNYGTIFNQATTDILTYAPLGTTVKKGDANYTKIMQLVSAIKTQLKSEVSSVEKLEESMTTWGGKMQAIHTKLVTGADDIQAAETKLKNDITTMNSAIKTLNTEINNDNKNLIKAEDLTYAGIATFVVGVVTAPVTGGVVAVAGAACIVCGAIEWSDLEKQIKKDFKTIGKDQVKIGVDKARIVALNSLNNATEQTVSSIDIVTANLSAVKAMWVYFQDEIQDVENEISKLKNGDPINFGKELDIQAAQDMWKKVMITANKLIATPYVPPIVHTVNITKTSEQDHSMHEPLRAVAR